MALGALAAIFAGSFVIGLTGALSPGPLTTVAIGESARRGFGAGPLLAAGHGALELALVVGLALGLNQVLDNDAVAATIAFVGGGFLVWLGLRIVRTAPHQDLDIGGPRSRPGVVIAGARTLPAAGLVAGMGVVVSLSNPFWLIWWATIGTAYIVESLEQGVAGVGSFYAGHVLADLAWLSLIAFVISSGRRLMSRGVYHGVLIACGILLVGLGGFFLWSGADRIL